MKALFVVLVKYAIAAILLAAMCLVMIGCEQHQESLRVIAFTAEWCVHCGCVEQKLRECENANVHVAIVDVDERPDVARNYGVDAVPTYVIIQSSGAWFRTDDLSEVLLELKRGRER